MGNEYEVYAWGRDDNYGQMCWIEFYKGSSLIKAVYRMWQAKRKGWLCMKLEWRPMHV